MNQNAISFKLRLNFLLPLLISTLLSIVLFLYSFKQIPEALTQLHLTGMRLYHVLILFFMASLIVVIFRHFNIVRQMETERCQLFEKIDEYNLLNEATGDAIWKLDMRTMRTEVNSKLVALLGYSKEAIAGNPQWWEDNLHPEDKPRMIALFQEAVTGSRLTCEAEYRFRCQDGKYLHFYDRTFIKRDPQGKVIYMIGAMQDVTRQKNLQRELIRQRIRYEHEMTRAVMEAQEKERENIGHNLHDNVNQLLASVNLYVNALKNKEAIDLEILNLASKTINIAIKEVRSLSHHIIPPWFKEKSLVNAIADHCNDILQSKQFEISFQHQDFNESKLDNDLKLHIYRIFQEQFSNTMKYSQCHYLHIELATTQKELIFRIMDDGVGFDPEKVKNGIGLLNIRKRVELFDGTLQIHSAPGEGSRLCVRIPLPDFGSEFKDMGVQELIA
ncbi:MAG TPA: PAS domain-containing protein [Flavisolibacter sp.]|jgi:two-component system sensor histidine kinase UhpB|nr:PAS domain-containing protein [Flavisolibacter sp.]